MDVSLLLEALNSCGVDTAEEQLLLRQRIKSVQCPTLLVIGDEPGRPLDLLQGLDIPSWREEHEPLTYPVECVKGTQLQITATDAKGVRNRYFDLPSFRAHRDPGVTHLELTVDAPILERVTLRFVTVNGETVARLPELAGDCAGVVLVLDSSAGAPEPAASELCHWLKVTAGMEERLCLVLNHTEQGAVNWMLEDLLEVEPRATLACNFDVPAQAEDSPWNVLASAVSMLGSAAGGEDALAAWCISSVQRRLKERMEQLERSAQEKDDSAQWFQENSAAFRAKMGIARSAINVQLTPEQKEALYSDIQGLRQQLLEQLPLMAEELVERNGKQAKQDMKNLAGEYVESLINHYMTFITRQIADRVLFPQAEKAFQESVEEYQRLISSAPVSVDEMTALENVELLKSIQINLGEYQSSLSRMLGNIVMFCIICVGGDTLGPFTYTVADSLGGLVEELVESVRSAKAYVQDYIKEKLEPELSRCPEMMFAALDETILPQINGDLVNWFKDVVDRCCDRMEAQSAALENEASVLRDQRAALEMDDGRLTGLL